jgi:hypothetical protein
VGMGGYGRGGEAHIPEEWCNWIMNSMMGGGNNTWGEGPEKLGPDMENFSTKYGEERGYLYRRNRDNRELMR